MEASKFPLALATKRSLVKAGGMGRDHTAVDGAVSVNEKVCKMFQKKFSCKGQETDGTVVWQKYDHRRLFFKDGYMFKC